MCNQLIPLCDRAGHFARLQSRLVRIAQDAVDQLQLDIKYLLFDLEATRRERDELREHLQAARRRVRNRRMTSRELRSRPASPFLDAGFFVICPLGRVSADGVAT